MTRSWKFWSHQSINPLIGPERNILFKRAGHNKRRDLEEAKHSGMFPGNISLSLASPLFFSHLSLPELLVLLYIPSASQDHEVSNSTVPVPPPFDAPPQYRPRNNGTSQQERVTVFVMEFKSCLTQKKRWKLKIQRQRLVKAFSSEDDLPQSRKRKHSRGPGFPWLQKTSGRLHFLGRLRLIILPSTPYPTHKFSNPHLTVGLLRVLSRSLP